MAFLKSIDDGLSHLKTERGRLESKIRMAKNEDEEARFGAELREIELEIRRFENYKQDQANA